MSSCYVSWKTSKSGEKIPCFERDKPSASLYNPQREAEQFAQMAKEGFIVVVGFASGLHILEIRKKYPTSKVLVVEKNEESIEFLEKTIKHIVADGVTLCTVQTLQSNILQLYFPPLDGSFTLLPLRSWVDANEDIYEQIKIETKDALEILSSDVSTQAHFGKLWHRNIIQNLQLCESVPAENLLNISKSIFPTQKIAFVAGAGPGLENHFDEIKQSREKYYIIATDTAYHALTMNDIVSDVVLSVDAQFISHNHFMCNKNERTIFAFDLCANPAAVKAVIKDNKTVCFFKSNHPLCLYASAWYKEETNIDFFPTICSTGGTVTLSALNFAKLVGFSKITSGGCDFGYIDGKMYAKGTYMDSVFNASANRLHTVEDSLSALMFRSTLKKEGNRYTTSLLEVYKEAYDNFFRKFNTNSKKSDCQSLVKKTWKKTFTGKKFIEYYRKQLIASDYAEINENTITTLLPFIAWYANKTSKQIKMSEIFKIALNVTIHS